MPRVTITIPDDIYDAVRDRAKANYRTINNQLRYELKQLIDTSTPISTQTPHRKTRIDAPVSQPQSQPPQTPPPQSEPQLSESERKSRQKSFTDLSKEILGHPLMETDYSLTPDNLYYPYAEEVKGKFLRYADTMPYEKQVEYLEEYKHYDK